MAISWTLIVLVALLQGMQCNDSPADPKGTTISVDATTADSTKSTVPLTALSSIKPTASASLESITVTTTLTSLVLTKSAILTDPSVSTTLATTLTSSEPTKLDALSSSTDSTTQATLTTKATSPDPTGPSSTVDKQMPTNNPTTQNSLVTTQITTFQPQNTNAGTTLTAFNSSPQNPLTTVITTVSNQVTNLDKLATTISTEAGTTQLLSTQTNPSAAAKNSAIPITTAPDSKSTASQSLGTMKAQTATFIPSQRNDENITTSTSTPQKPFNHFFDLSSSTEENIVRQACKTLGQKMKGNCSVKVTIHDKQLIAEIIIDADQKIAPENYEPLEPVNGVNGTENNALQKEDINKGTIPDTLIAILASCGALVLILCCFAAYCTYHRRSYRKNQQHLTEELQTVENGYHDNPTLEVMEVQPEMQEKKLTMNGEFNDSWIVPIDNLLKEDIPDEEDTHL